jgi:hypothetical protein
MSMMLAGALKRTKRTMQNLERQFLNPLICKSMWRYLQFNPTKYGQDWKFVVNCSMGIMAKEMENQQLIQMLGFCPPESPAHAIVLKALFYNTASSEKRELKEAIDQLTAPPSPEQQQQQQAMQQLQMRQLIAEVQKLEAEVQNLTAQAGLNQAKTVHEMVNANLEDDRVEIEAANAATGAAKVHVAREGNEVKKEVAKSKPKPTSKGSNK